MAERLKQRPAQWVGQRPHGLRVGQVELQPIVARPRPILVSAGLSSAGLSSADRTFAGLYPAGLYPAGLSSACPILAARFIASPACARLRFIGPIFGSHVSKDYSRKSRFDKSSKHFFREISIAPAALSGAECKSVTSAPPAPDPGQLVSRGRPGTSQRTELRARRHHQHHSSYAPDQPERHETPDPGRSDAVNSRFQGVRPTSGWHQAGVGLASWWPSRRSRYPSAREVAATAIMAA